MKVFLILFFIISSFKLYCQIDSPITFVDNYSDKLLQINKIKKLVNSKLCDCRGDERVYFPNRYSEIFDVKVDTFLYKYKSDKFIYMKNSLFYEPKPIFKAKYFVFLYNELIPDTLSKLTGYYLDDFFIVIDYKIDSLFFKNAEERGYLTNDLLKITYTTFWNKVLYKLNLISEFSYIDRLKCVDYNMLRGRLRKKVKHL